MADKPDVLVIGAGAAGISAAIFAAERGAKVRLIEAGDRLGGTVLLSTGQVSAAGTRLQAARGIVDSPEAHVRDILRIAHGTGDQRFIRLAVENAADTFEWLLSIGWRPAAETPAIHAGHEPYETPRTYWAEGGGRDLAAALCARVEAMAADGMIEIELQTRMRRLIIDGGRVNGAHCERADGLSVETVAGSTVLTSGGYGRNATLFQQLHGFSAKSWGNAHSLGDGLVAAREIGAIVDHTEDFLPTVGGIVDIDRPDKCWIATRPRYPYRDVWEIFVNLCGDRFVDETSHETDQRERIVLEQPEMAFWVIYDERMRCESSPLFVWPEEKIARAFAAHEDFQHADTIEELATACRLPVDRLRRTVLRFNAAQAAQVRDETGRRFLPAPLAEPPFYAVKHYGITVVSFGGLRVNERLQVVTDDRRPIAGLYAAGEILGLGLFGNAFTGGMALMPAMTFGRLIGQRFLPF